MWFFNTFFICLILGVSWQVSLLAAFYILVHKHYVLNKNKVKCCNNG